MKAWPKSNRVMVVQALAQYGSFAHLPVMVDIRGTVRRRRNADEGAWVELDARGPSCVHPFEWNDKRALHVLTYPAWCKAARDGGGGK